MLTANCEMLLRLISPLRRRNLRPGFGGFLARFHFFGGKNQVQRIAFLPRSKLHDSVLANIFDQALQDLASQAGARHFPAPKEDGRFHLVSFIQEAQHVIFLGVIVVIIHVDAEFHFFDGNRLLVLLGLAFLFFLLVKVLPVIHDAANRRICGGRNLNQIQILLAGHLERFEGRHDSNLLAFVANYADFACADALVRANKTFIDTILRSLASEWECKIIARGQGLFRFQVSGFSLIGSRHPRTLPNTGHLRHLRHIPCSSADGPYSAGTAMSFSRR
jgi:hypothetical protein